MKDNWDDCDVWTQALILAFGQTREHDDTEFAIKLAGGGKPTPVRKR